MVEFVSFGNRRTYEDFQRNIPKSILPLFDKLRVFCNSLGDKVVEDVRMHRIVFSKSITFRWFADIEPTQTSILIKIQKDRKTTIKTIEVFREQELEEVYNVLKEAYFSIR